MFPVRKLAYYYHTSTKPINDLKPFRLRVFTETEDRPEEEPHEKRACVSPTVSGCIAAIGHNINQHFDCYVYRSVEKVQAYYPYRVADSKITQERWLLKPMLFKHVTNFNVDMFDDWMHGFIVTGSKQKRYLKIQKQYKDKVKQILEIYNEQLPKEERFVA